MPFTPVTIITKNPTMLGIIDQIKRIKESNSSVILIGETGVGKEVFADFVHRTSNRMQQPFIKIGLAAFPPDLMASELFGHEKGAFTSAIGAKKGMFELANTGTIFLDDIDDVPLEIQTKLLRVLESRELIRVGGIKTLPVDIRVISSSKISLKELVKRNRFRADLFYRLNVVPIEIPPLRKRKDDISLLTNYFLEKFSPNQRFSIKEDAMKALENYPWPGNVRELRNVVQRISLFAKDTIDTKDLPEEIAKFNLLDNISNTCMLCLTEQKMTLTHVIQCVEQRIIESTLDSTNGNQSEAARILGLSLSTFRDKWKRCQSQLSQCKDLKN